MSADWQIGDRALCVNAGPCPYCEGGSPLPGLHESVVYTVAGVTPIDDPGGPLLDLEEICINPHWGLCSPHFRKITPDKHEACEEEFVTLLNRTRVPEHVSGGGQ